MDVRVHVVTISPDVYLAAADLIEYGGLCKATNGSEVYSYAHLAPRSSRARGRSVVGAVANACVQTNHLSDGGITRHLTFLRRFAGVDHVLDIQAGRATAETVCATLRQIAAEAGMTHAGVAKVVRRG